MDMEVSMNMSNTNGDTKVVQTELNPAEYARFRRLAQEEGKSLKEALREAATEYIDAHDAPDPSDPLFAVADEMAALNEGRRGEPLAPDELDDALYERPHGDDDE
ncbi:ribbon-helix-helix protein, CopG family [Haladaptatus salinisoli]|uniref:ribbon-helix-helix protein, CopG family n=1 Tax=Haladaptatus salinisoli TaxID=2884876 RepID=UPI001D0A33DC|nr:ribbon-helix-helix protein, CopG family [Haladaptatus salinisoli]